MGKQENKEQTPGSAGILPASLHDRSNQERQARCLRSQGAKFAAPCLEIGLAPPLPRTLQAKSRSRLL